MILLWIAKESTVLTARSQSAYITSTATSALQEISAFAAIATAQKAAITPAAGPLSLRTKLRA